MKWGITVSDEMLLDTKNDSFPIPQNRDLGGGTMVREVAQLPYPFFVKADGTQLADNMITNGLAGTVMLSYGAILLLIESQLSLNVSLEEMEFIRDLSHRRVLGDA